MTDTAHFRDFTKKRPPVYFHLNDERFDCAKAINPKKLQRAMNTFRGLKTDIEKGVDESNVADLLDRISDTMVFFMKAESYERFHALINDEDADEPVDHEQLVAILTWLLGEVYSARPSKPSSDSTTTSPIDGTGTISTDGAQLETSTQ